MRDPAVTSRIMRKIPQKDTRAEVFLRKELFRRGHRYRKNVLSLPGKPDILFTRAKLCVFVDGDFWHGREWRNRGYSTIEEAFKTNQDYWVKKIKTNIARDREVEKELEALGYSFLRIWESVVLKDVSSTANLVEESLKTILKGHDNEN